MPGMRETLLKYFSNYLKMNHVCRHMSFKNNTWSYKVLVSPRDLHKRIEAGIV